MPSPYPVLTQEDPRSLQPAPWNPNRASPEDQKKLDESLKRFNLFKPIVCRELDDGSLQILGGHWRVDSAIRLDFKTVPVMNLGPVPDHTAKEITLVDNGRYGHDDAAKLAELIAELGDPIELASFMPYDLIELDAFSAATKIDLDTLGLDEEDAPAPERKERAPKTHEIMRFKVPIEDSRRVSDLLKSVMQEQGFTSGDQLTNAGDALVHVLLNGDT